MVESESLYTKNFGWFVWLEHRINMFMLMFKSIGWIFFASLFFTYLAAIFTVMIGIYDTKLTFDFFTGFLKLSWDSMFGSGSQNLLSRAFDVVSGELGEMFFWHSPIGVVVAYFMTKITIEKSKKMGETTFIDGTKLVGEEQRLMEIEKRKMAGEVFQFELGRIPMPLSSITARTLIVATSGGGKGVLLSKIMKEIGERSDAKGMCHDIKPEWINKCYRPERGDLIFNPMEARSLAWTMWNDIDDVLDIENFVNWIIPDNPDAKDPFWQESARGILLAIMRYLWHTGQTSNKALKFMINLPADTLKEMLVGFDGVEFLEKSDSILTLKSKMNWLTFLSDGDFSIREFLNSDKRGMIFISNTAKTNAMMAPLLTLFITVFSSELLSLPDSRTRQIFVILDEFTSLKKIQLLLDLVNKGRSKGASIWLAFQVFQRLKEIYSEGEMREIIGNCKNLAIGQITEEGGAEFFSKAFGQAEFYEKGDTTGMGVNENKDGLSLNDQRKEAYVVKPYSLLNLKEGEFFVKISGLEGVTKTMADIIDMPDIADGLILRKWTKDEQIAMVTSDNSSVGKTISGEGALKREVQEETEWSVLKGEIPDNFF